MNEPATQPTVTAEPTASPQPGPSLEERAHNVLAELRGESPSGVELSASPEASAPAPATDARAERKVRLDAIAAKQRASVDRKHKATEGDRAAAQFVELQRQTADLQRVADARIDPASLDEAGFFGLAERLQISPAKLGEWIREQIANPERGAAEAAAKRVRAEVNPEVAALKSQIEELKDVVGRDQAQRTEREYSQAEMQSAREFFALTESRATDAPYAAAYLRHHGPEKFYELASAAASRVDHGSGLDSVLDIIEERLSELAPVYAPTSQLKASSKPVAAARANTISNQLASARSTVVEDVDFSKLSLDERAAMLIRNMG